MIFCNGNNPTFLSTFMAFAIQVSASASASAHARAVFSFHLVVTAKLVNHLIVLKFLLPLTLCTVLSKVLQVNVHLYIIWNITYITHVVRRGANCNWANQWMLLWEHELESVYLVLEKKKKGGKTKSIWMLVELNIPKTERQTHWMACSTLLMRHRNYTE